MKAPPRHNPQPTSATTATRELREAEAAKWEAKHRKMLKRLFPD
jgi:hypothetical protein